MGLLIDAADQYAANIGGSVNEVDRAGGTLLAKLTFASPRPVRINSDTSSDLASWSPNLTGQKKRDANPRVWTVGTDAGSDHKFMRVSAKSPEQ